METRTKSDSLTFKFSYFRVGGRKAIQCNGCPRNGIIPACEKLINRDSVWRFWCWCGSWSSYTCTSFLGSTPNITLSLHPQHLDIAYKAQVTQLKNNSNKRNCGIFQYEQSLFLFDKTLFTVRLEKEGARATFCHLRYRGKRQVDSPNSDSILSMVSSREPT